MPRHKSCTVVKSMITNKKKKKHKPLWTQKGLKEWQTVGDSSFPAQTLITMFLSRCPNLLSVSVCWLENKVWPYIFNGWGMQPDAIRDKTQFYCSWVIFFKKKKKIKIHYQKGKRPTPCPLRQQMPFHTHQSRILQHNVPQHSFEFFH